MIMREKILDVIKQETYRRMTAQELANVLDATSSDDFKELVKALVQLEDDHILERDKKDRYDLMERFGYKVGTIHVHKKGYGFVILDDKDEPDIFIPKTKINGAFHNDRVIVSISPAKSGEKKEGVVKRIIERGTRYIIGVYKEKKGVGYVISDDSRFQAEIVINKNNSMGAMPDHKVKVEILQYITDTQVEGKVTEILGHKNDPGIDILSIVYKHGLPTIFPEEVMEHANRIPDTLSEEDFKGRRDLREETIVTMDGEDAKDLDDAITVDKLDSGNYRLGVHIADVSYYVREGDPIDREAYRRGTSTYLVDRVIPMLPHRLSNGICSLNPNEDRLTISCVMEINDTGQVVNHDIFPSVIRSKARMTYTAVNKILVEQDEETKERYQELVPMFETMQELYEILKAKRRERGAINFETSEAQIIVDEEGKPIDVRLRTRDVAEKIIEEFMLVANETIAEHFHWMNVPFIYRIHEDPNEEKLRKFFQLLSGLGYKVKGTANHIHPKALQAVLDEVEGEAEEAVINTVMLRTMQKAKYSEQSIGHYGLSTMYYTHFTSPIRRYPDLIVHRLIRKYIFERDLSETTQNKYYELLPEISTHTSFCERRAVDCERDVESMKKAEFMMDKLGEEYEGIISSVTNWGIFVELPNTIEGLVHVLDLTDDYYYFDEKTYSLVGERTKKRYRIGDQVKIKVIGASKETGEVDFAIVGITERKRKKNVVIETEKDTGRRGKERKTRRRREKKLRNRS